VVQNLLREEENKAYDKNLMMKGHIERYVEIVNQGGL
jgi:hypothetical protein